MENGKLYEFMRQEMTEVKERLAKIDERLCALDAFMHQENGKRQVWESVKNNFISFTALGISVAVAILGYLKLYK